MPNSDTPEQTPSPPPDPAGPPATAARAIPAADEHATFPVVGIGASAGGLAAFEAFFSAMPVDSEPGMAFVLVQHLAPDHKSILTELVRRYTQLDVFEIEDGMVVQRNCAYIIPPNRDVAFLNGTLQLLEPDAPRGQRLPIDFFFRSLAHDQRERAIGIVLSGTGSDGTLGVRAIKGEGGMVMAQNPESTEFDGMPRSAIATGLVDFELPPAEMPAQLIAYAAHAFKLARTMERGAAHRTEGALKKIFVLLRAQTGHDFSQYKPSTINRRIERRMAVHQIDVIDRYVSYLQRAPAEVEALFRDLLIGVTNFFRDADAFRELELRVIPGLFDDKLAGSAVRIWSTGCSTGEEAYSIAILLQERMDALKENYLVQVFATDIDSRAIAIARAGIYPASIAADLSPERLAQFFTAEAGGAGYRVHKRIRDMLVFSEHDVLKDPPFSRLDMISCRNLLIYMNGELQQRLIPLFHYALKPGGVLFLGTSEGIGEFVSHFAVLDRKLKLYQRKDDAISVPRATSSDFGPADITRHARGTIGTPLRTSRARLPLRELTEQALLQQLAPSSVLVNAQGDILYQHGRTGRYLELPQGEAGTSNILKMAREGLRGELAACIHRAVSSNAVAHSRGLRVRTNHHFSHVNVSVCPVVPKTGAAPEPPLFLVILEESADPLTHPTEPAAAPDSGAARTDSDIALLQRELRAKEEHLQSALEQLDTSSEELKSSMEEMQSVNEELQSTNEELETSKEELQSVNEELGTVNTELQTKVTDLSRVNNDMNNLLAGTGIGTLFVDHQLRVMRFTPAARAITNLIASDVGRPVNHIVSNLVGYDSLPEDVRAVLNTLVPKEATVTAADGKSYSMRISPYRTLDNVIEGAVISFVDTTEAVRMSEALRKANELARLAIVVRDAHDAITVQDLGGSTLAWNPGAERMYGWSESEALQMNVQQRIPEALRRQALQVLRQLSQAEELQPYSTQRLTKQGGTLAVSIISTALINETGTVYAIATTERAIGGTTP